MWKKIFIVFLVQSFFIGFSYSNYKDTSLLNLTESGPIEIKDQNDVIIENMKISNENGNCIVLLRAKNVKIINSEIGPCSGKGISMHQSDNITIQNSYFHDTYLSAIESDKSNNVLVDSNIMEDVQTGYHIWGKEWPGENTRNISFTNNYVKNVGRRELKGYGGNIVMVASVNSGTLINVSNNIGINELGEKSNPEDLINIFKSNGVKESPIMIKNNKFLGGGPSTSGGGILLSDGGGSYQTAEDNILVNPGQYGIQIGGGQNNILRNNKVYSDPYRDFTNVGLVLWRYYSGPEYGTPPGECYNHTIENNTITYYQAANYNNNGLPARLISHWIAKKGSDGVEPSCTGTKGFDTNKFDYLGTRNANLDMSLWNPEWNLPNSSMGIPGQVKVSSGSGTVDDVTSSGSGTVDDVTSSGSGTVDDAVSSGSGTVDDAVSSGSGTVDDAVSSGSGTVDDAVSSGSGTVDDAVSSNNVSSGGGGGGGGGSRRHYYSYEELYALQKSNLNKYNQNEEEIELNSAREENKEAEESKNTNNSDNQIAEKNAKDIEENSEETKKSSYKYELTNSAEKKLEKIIINSQKDDNTNIYIYKDKILTNLDMYLSVRKSETKNSFVSKIKIRILKKNIYEVVELFKEELRS